MSGEKYEKFQGFVNDARKELKELVSKRNQLNNKIKNYIISFQRIEYEIYKTLFNSRQYYKEKRYYCDKKIRKLRRKAIEYDDLLYFLVNERNKLQEPRLNSNISNLINYFENSIKELNNKINNLNKKVKKHILKIEEEIRIVEKIRKLQKRKQKKLNILTNLKKDLIKEIKSTEYYRIDDKIKLFETMLNEINKNLIKWSNKRKKYHKKMLGLYREARIFRKFKKKMEIKLRENRDAAEYYYDQFLELMNENQRYIIEGELNKSKHTPKQQQIITPRIESIIERKQLLREFRKEKLMIALEKQKAGKKLNFYELKLILEQSKNNKFLSESKNLKNIK